MFDSEIIIYLKKLCGYDVELPNHPHCRFSELLHKINNPKYELSFTYPVCRIEEYLLDIINGTMKMLDETPRSNIEMFLAVKIGRTDIALPKPMSEIDWWLNEWLKAIKDIYIELNGAVDYTINETLAGDLVIKEIAGNTVQDIETNIVPTPQRPVPVVSKKITVKKLSLNAFPLEEESDTSKIPDNGTYRSVMEHELKPNTTYKFSYSGINVPAKATLALRVSSPASVLENIFTKMNFGSEEIIEPGAEIVFTTNSTGKIKFEYNCNVNTSTSTETFKEYWYTKIVNDIVLKEDVEPTEELIELRGLKSGSIKDVKIVDHVNKRSWIERNIKEINLNELVYSYAGGNEIDEGVRFYAPLNLQLKYAEEIYCNVFPGYSNYRYDLESIYGGNANGGRTLSIIVKENNIISHTQEALLEYINNSNAVAYYALENPIIEEIEYLEDDSGEEGYSFQDDTSPSPGIPSPTKSVSEINVKTVGKNLIDYTKISFSRANLENKIVISNITDHYYSHFSIPASSFFNGKSITFSILPLQDFNRQVAVVAFFNDGNYIDRSSDNGVSHVTIELPNDKNISRFEFRFNRSRERFTDTSSRFYNFQIEIGDTETNYEPYQETSIAHVLENQIFKTGITADKIDVLNAKITKINHVFVLNDTYSQIFFDKTRNKTQVFAISGTGLISNQNLICDKLQNNNDSDTEGFVSIYRTLYIAIDKRRLTENTIFGFREWLKDNPLMFVGQTNPTTKQLESALVEKLKQLKSFNGVTNVICQNTPKYSNLKFEIRVKSQASSMLCLRSDEDV